ncbi:hypothetical protein [Bacillus wiedmannii]|uniref:hypothetical protein n=1 Tax=Bacillus wiedmannii TaxID=1890302 RepID=UPI0015CF2186|nr:hypothetical protein [Bacillus wiedmannii]
MRLIWNNETPISVHIPPLGIVYKGDIVDVLGKDEIEALKKAGFEKAPKFESKEGEGK